MAAQRSGLIVNVSFRYPEAAGSPYIGHLMYDLAKAALCRLVQGLGTATGVQPPEEDAPALLPVVRPDTLIASIHHTHQLAAPPSARAPPHTHTHTTCRMAFGLAEELRPHGVVALALSPGHMRTERVLRHYATGKNACCVPASSAPPCLLLWDGGVRGRVKALV